jgi:hypothetical protein
MRVRRGVLVSADLEVLREIVAFLSTLAVLGYLSSR